MSKTNTIDPKPQPPTLYATIRINGLLRRHEKELDGLAAWMINKKTSAEVAGQALGKVIDGLYRNESKDTRAAIHSATMMLYNYNEVLKAWEARQVSV